MSIAVRFDRERAKEILDALAKGAAVPVHASSWTVGDCFVLAGAALFAAADSAPALLGIGDEDWRRLHLERRETMAADLREDLMAAVAWCCEATRLVRDQEYDERFEPVHTVLLARDGDRRVAVPISGIASQVPPE